MIRLMVALIVAITTPAVARVNLERLDRQAWECALWVRATSGGRLDPSHFNYRVTPHRDGTVGVESWGIGSEPARFNRCLREKGNVLEREPAAVTEAREIARFRAQCRTVGPGDRDWDSCLRAFGPAGVRQGPSAFCDDKFRCWAVPQP